MCSVVAVPGVYCPTISRPGRPSITTYVRIWHIDGVWEQLNTALRERLRVRLGRNPQPSAGMVDSQSAKTTGVGGEARGYDGGKKVRGRKRHLLVDTEGLLHQRVFRLCSDDSTYGEAVSLCLELFGQVLSAT